MSSGVNYQCKWKVYRYWCKDDGYSSSRPSIPKQGDFIILHRVKVLLVLTIKDYQSMLSGVFNPKAVGVFAPDVTSRPGGGGGVMNDWQ